MFSKVLLSAITFLMINISVSSALLPNLASKDAKVGGTFKFNLRTQPKTLNPLGSSDIPARRVKYFVMETLGERNLDTYEFMPVLATKWEVSKDGLTFDITLREGVKWHDGKPLTVEDVKFSFDAILDPQNRYNTANLKPYYDNFKECKITSKNTLRFIAKRKYFGNLSVLMSLWVVPRHLHENADKKMKRKLNKTMVGTGPYKLSKFTRGKFLKFERNKDWWGFKTEEGKNRYNYDRMTFRFIQDDNAALQYLNKGKIDLLYFSDAETYLKKAVGKNWGKKLFKVKYQNKKPKSYAFIGWNLNNDLFKSKKVRKALAHLVDREKMIEKFLYGYSRPATGPWYQDSMYADQKLKPTPFDPKTAAKLLKEEGWSDTDGDGILDKVINGVKRPFRFTMLEPYKPFRKYQVVYQQDLKKAGIDMQIKLIDWTSFIKLVDERKFEAIRMAWGAGSVHNDPKQIWHSTSYNNKGSNFIGYNNPKVDKLIDEARQILDHKKRIPKMQEIYRTIAADYPYVFLFNKTHDFYGHTKKMKRPKDTYVYEIGDLQGYWWMSDI